MATLSFLQGGDCGASNPLAQLSKAYGQGSTARDGFSPQPLQSSGTFRQHPSGAPYDFSSDATRFFETTSFPNPFDFAHLRHSLLESSPSVATAENWAGAFASGHGAGIESFEPSREAFMERMHGLGEDGVAWSRDFARENGGAPAPERSQSRGAGAPRFAGQSMTMGMGGIGVWSQALTQNAVSSAAFDWDAAFDAQGSAVHLSHQPPSETSTFTSLDKGKSRETQASLAASSTASSAFAPSLEPLLSSPPTTTTPSEQSSARTAHEFYTLGLHHQILEREALAIEAFHGALALNPSMGEAHLALSTSYANDGRRAEAYISFAQWVESLCVGRYRGLVEGQWRLPEEGSWETRAEALREVLLRMVRSEGEGMVDAEVQMGLGLLFTLGLEFDKAGDCYGAALGEMPDDPLLLNRLAVTLTNGGKPETALPYYLAALELHPGYVRCRANLAIACANLSNYQDAVEHLVIALTIQESDYEEDDAGNLLSGETSYALWESLNNCLHMMGRSDIASLTLSMDLDGLRAALLPV